MNLVYIHHSLAIRGGLERVWADKMNGLAKVPGYEITLITTDQCGQPFAYPLSQEIRHIDLGGIRYHSIYHHSYPRRFWDIYRFQRDFRKRLLQVLPVVKPDIIIANTSFCPEQIATLPYPCKKIVEVHIAYIFTLRAGPEHRNLPHWQYAMKTLYDKVFLYRMQKFDELVTLTEQDSDRWRRHRHAVCIPNPVTEFPDVMHDGEERKQIVAVGRLYGQKGYDLLAEAWVLLHRKYPDWHITIYGDGNEKAQIEAYFRQLGVEDSIHIHPAIPDIWRAYLESDFLVLSSRTEGFGLVLVEAMSCGIPCVAFNCPSGPDEIITDGVDGRIARNGDIAHLAEQMEYMMTHPEERRRMGMIAWEHSKRYGKEAILRQWTELFESLAGSGKSER